MILRDAIHGLVSFDGPAEAIIEPLLRAREVQRLRRVRQLGLTSLVFPGAEHTRFSHALGAAHVMVRLLDRIAVCEHELPAEARLTPMDKADALAAALLHDLGHGPFSHLFEEVLPHARHHEEWTVDAIRDPGTDVSRVLSGIDAEMPARVASLITGEHRVGYLSRAVSGTLDVDRCDYLLRDSHMTGVRYGIYDLDWLLRALKFAWVGDTKGGEWVLAVEGRKGLPAAEGFFLARHFMYSQVYHHKATRAAECLIRGIFARVAELVREDDAPSPMPAALRAAAEGAPVTLEEYLALDDAQLVACFTAWQREKDPILADLSRRFMARALPKTIPLPEDEEGRARWHPALERAREVAERHGLRPDLHVWLDIASDTPYEEPDDASADGLWVALRHQPMRRIGDVSFLLGQLRGKKLDRPRLVFPAEIRDEVVSALQEWIT